MTLRGRAFAVVDLGFGDAGKGRVIDALARAHGARLVVRFNGGGQAGHNVVRADGRHHTFSHFGAGTFVEGTDTLLARDVVVHPTALAIEADALATKGVHDPLGRIHVDAACRITTPFHQAANRIRESVRAAARHGSCGAGFGETVADALDAPARCLRAGTVAWEPGRAWEDLLATRQRVRAGLEDVWRIAGSIPDLERECDLFGDDRFAEQWWVRVQPVVARVTCRSVEARIAEGRADGPVLFEGAQGVLLDAVHGFAPHTTWSDCTFRGAFHAWRSAGGDDASLVRLGVLRSHLVRHGAGPFPTEDPRVSDAVHEPHNRIGPWQGPVRHGWPDLVLLRYALRACGGIDALALTHLDAVGRGTPWRVRVAPETFVSVTGTTDEAQREDLCGRLGAWANAPVVARFSDARSGHGEWLSDGGRFGAHR